MDRLYKDVSEEFLSGLRRYINDEISYSELKRLSTREALAFDSHKWDEIIEKKSLEALGMKRRMYDEILQIEERVKTMEKLERGEEFDADLEGLVSHSGVVGRNRSHPPGYENTSLYLPPFPSLPMVSFLNDSEGESSAESQGL
ncbi:hypothetical protein EHEL_060790 [Encephalitozoon hellem ATCC 50504]|uniref:Uncharacterized protein n=1 Tax=Encephalitozoon hellem TaxID=27973 RepID=A0A9Q9C3B9_ENCHE|nr:uncharacterized protein EHEL_060790 [Encephalitozoon hellem ATCC 50504]AFM98451.1 hypothetical protein EHEL_060790 [Encephalitozoon hellem ATCC 50504]UTX43376.1 hypothetical protein GPU96_06g11240 [Encephalitozoon hellem]WEL38840.1 hypothetical protein PFJ87_06g01070 [Encephalitozoon hellem]|eukprot:XP_003887432.1 hypothetical protein EHEL_060790 [Encephalitozoon hellem ATCC 50504]